MYSKRQMIGFFLGPIIFFIILLCPLPSGMKPEALRMAAITAMMAVWWISEAVPIPATALLPVALFPTLNIMDSATACAPYANHLIFLFLGGFLIAICMEKWNLHKRLALYTIRLVGVGPRRIILGFMIASAFISMWISNTATAMMMMPIALAVINQTADFLSKQNNTQIDTRPGHFRFGMALMLGVAYASSIGGVATIIGTPPNTILVGFLEKTYGQQISFASWMAFAAPLSAIMLLLTWVYLVKIALPPEIKELPGGKALIYDEIGRLGKISSAEKMILVVFILVAAAWILRGFITIGSQMMHDATIAIIGALLLFVIPVDFKKGEFLMDWRAAVKVPWDIILLFGGGLAIADGFMQTGLAGWIGQQLSLLQGAGYFSIIFVIVLLTIFLTEVTSNTAVAAMMIPITASIAIASAIHPFGPIFGACIAASYAFMLPVATPPNAIVFGARYITIPTMARTGFALNILGTILITLLIILLLPVVWDIDLMRLPAWINTSIK